MRARGNEDLLDTALRFVYGAFKTTLCPTSHLLCGARVGIEGHQRDMARTPRARQGSRRGVAWPVEFVKAGVLGATLSATRVLCKRRARACIGCVTQLALKVAL